MEKRKEQTNFPFPLKGFSKGAAQQLGIFAPLRRQNSSNLESVSITLQPDLVSDQNSMDGEEW
jgi:hypothetical protein